MHLMIEGQLERKYTMSDFCKTIRSLVGPDLKVAQQFCCTPQRSPFVFE